MPQMPRAMLRVLQEQSEVQPASQRPVREPVLEPQPERRQRQELALQRLARQQASVQRRLVSPPLVWLQRVLRLLHQPASAVPPVWAEPDAQA